MIALAMIVAAVPVLLLGMGAFDGGPHHPELLDD